VRRADSSTEDTIIGVVSTKPGLLLGFDDTSLNIGETGYPIGLAGRVPVRLSTENGPIKKGDKITISSISGIGMKAVSGSRVVGIALEDYDGTRAYSEGYLNQFGDDLVNKKTTPREVNTDTRTQDGCYYGGGNAQGEKECESKNVVVKKPAKTKIDTTREDTLNAIRNEVATTAVTPEGESVTIGQVIMFIDLSWQHIDREALVLSELASTTALSSNGETLWDRIKNLATHFVDGVLTVAEVVAKTFTAEKVDTKMLCVGETCVDEEALKALLQNSGQTSSSTGGGGDVSNSVEPDPAGGSSSENVTPDAGGGVGDAEEQVPTSDPGTDAIPIETSPLELTNPEDSTSNGASPQESVAEPASSPTIDPVL
jgi:hypothetical protein